MSGKDQLGAFTLITVVEDGIIRVGCSVCGEIGYWHVQERLAGVHVGTKIDLHATHHVYELMEGLEMKRRRPPNS